MQIGTAILTSAGGDISTASTPIVGGQVREPASLAVLSLLSLALLRRRRSA